MTGQTTEFAFPEYHQWRRDDFDAIRARMSNRLRELADELDRIKVRYDDPNYVPSAALAGEHYGDEVTVAASIAAKFTEGIRHAGGQLDRLITSAHECAIIRWQPEQQQITDMSDTLDRLVRAAQAVLDTPTGKVARQGLREAVEYATERNVP